MNRGRNPRKHSLKDLGKASGNYWGKHSPENWGKDSGNDSPRNSGKDSGDGPGDGGVEFAERALAHQFSNT